MNTEEFKDLCALYGGELADWPEQLRHDAVSWLSRATGPQIETCETHLAETVAFDQTLYGLDDVLLADMPSQKQIENLENDIFAKAIHQEQSKKSGHVLTRAIRMIYAAFGMRFQQTYLFAPVGSLAVVALIGFMIGSGQLGAEVVQPMDEVLLLETAYYEVQALTETYD